MSDKAEPRRSTAEKEGSERATDRGRPVHADQERATQSESQDATPVLTYGVLQDGSWGPKYENDGTPPQDGRREATIDTFRPPRYEYRGLRHARYLVNWLNRPQVACLAGKLQRSQQRVLPLMHWLVELSKNPFDGETKSVNAVTVELSKAPFYGERQAVNAVIELASQGLLDRVRRCQYCGRWFYQTRTKGKRVQVACSEACRKRNHALARQKGRQSSRFAASPSTE